MATKFTNIFYFKTLQKITQIDISGLKICHLATLEAVPRSVSRSLADLVQSETNIMA
jgi:hypothetical protein